MRESHKNISEISEYVLSLHFLQNVRSIMPNGAKEMPLPFSPDFSFVKNEKEGWLKKLGQFNSIQII